MCPRLKVVGLRVFKESVYEGRNVELQWRFVQNESQLKEDDRPISLKSLTEPIDVAKLIGLGWA